MLEFFRRLLNKHSDRIYDLLVVMWLLICLGAWLSENKFVEEFGGGINERNRATIEQMEWVSPL